MISRESILCKTPALAREEVAVPEWGGSVWARTLTGAERDRLEIEWTDTARVNFRARLVAYTACDGDGVNLFTVGDIPALGRQPTSALSRVCDVAFRLNLFTAGDQEDLRKNSESGPPDDPS